MSLARVGKGERIAAVSAILLFVFMFAHWFGVKATNTSNFLFAIQSVEQGKNAWEALDCISIFLVITVLATLAVAVLHLTSTVRRVPLLVSSVVAPLGIVSVMLIVFRIVEPPIFNVEKTVTYEGTVQFPIFLALAAACGIAYGGYRAMREGGRSFADLRVRRH